MPYLTRAAILKNIYNQCSNRFGFDKAFSDIDLIPLNMLYSLISHQKEIHTVYCHSYNEVLDFIDGNGFKVEGNDTDGYTISLLNN